MWSDGGVYGKIVVVVHGGGMYFEVGTVKGHSSLARVELIRTVWDLALL